MNDDDLDIVADVPENTDEETGNLGAGTDAPIPVATVEDKTDTATIPKDEFTLKISSGIKIPSVTRAEFDRVRADLQDTQGMDGEFNSEHQELGGGSDLGGGVDYDKIYVGGIEYTPGANTNNYDFLQVFADGSSAWIPAMISPMPTGSEIFNIRKNHIHITGATAGNI